MIAYVESNFVLEVALRQEEAEAAEAILRLAEDRKLQLAFPAFALMEPFSTIRYHHVERQRLARSVDEQLKQLQRSTPHKQVAASLKRVPIALGEIYRTEIDLLEQTVGRLLAAGKPIEVNRSSFAEALGYERRYDLTPQDALIYAAVIEDLRQQDPTATKCFISRNWKDFSDPGIESGVEFSQLLLPRHFCRRPKLS